MTDVFGNIEKLERDRERLKQASKSLLASLKALLQPMPDWTQKEATQAEVKVFILPLSEAEKLCTRLSHAYTMRKRQPC